MAGAPVRFALYVSAVRGHLVTRFGTDSRGVQSFIGAYRQPGRPTEIIWDEETIVPLSEAEVARYRREYQRALDAGAVKKRTAAEYEAQVAARTKADEAARARTNAPSPATPPASKSPKENA